MDQLSPAQRQIVTYPLDHGHMLVLAAPGSGKTRTITERVGSILTRRLVLPESVLVMTFTIKAAGELLNRLGDRLDTHIQEMWVGTFHSICDRLLHDYGGAIGWAPPFFVYDAPHQTAALQRAAAQAGWCLTNRRELNDLRDAIGRRKRQGLQPDQQPFTGPADPDHVLEIDEIYRRMLEDARALDYDDLILKGIQVLKEDHEAAQALQQRFKYVFLDEFHDVSPEQYALVSAIVPRGSRDSSVMVVADPNQAIYGWRQAHAPRTIAQFQHDYRPTIFQLEENYRSCGQIVRAAHHVITRHGTEASAIAVKPVRRFPRNRRANSRNRLTAFSAVASGSSSPVNGCDSSVP